MTVSPAPRRRPAAAPCSRRGLAALPHRPCSSGAEDHPGPRRITREGGPDSSPRRAPVPAQPPMGPSLSSTLSTLTPFHTVSCGIRPGIERLASRVSHRTLGLALRLSEPCSCCFYRARPAGPAQSFGSATTARQSVNPAPPAAGGSRPSLLTAPDPYKARVPVQNSV